MWFFKRDTPKTAGSGKVFCCNCRHYLPRLEYSTRDQYCTGFFDDCGARPLQEIVETNYITGLVRVVREAGFERALTHNRYGNCELYQPKPPASAGKE